MEILVNILLCGLPTNISYIDPDMNRIYSSCHISVLFVTVHMIYWCYQDSLSHFYLRSDLFTLQNFHYQCTIETKTESLEEYYCC